MLRSSDAAREVLGDGAVESIYMLGIFDGPYVLYWFEAPPSPSLPKPRSFGYAMTHRSDPGFDYDPDRTPFDVFSFGHAVWSKSKKPDDDALVQVGSNAVWINWTGDGPNDFEIRSMKASMSLAEALMLEADLIPRVAWAMRTRVIEEARR